MSTNKEDMIDYDFEAVNLDTFKLVLLLHIRGEMFDRIFSLSKKALKSSVGLDVQDKSPEDIEEFEGDKRFFGAAKTSIKRVCKKIFKEISKDKIIVINYHVEGIKFKKNKKFVPPCWIAEITLGGLYVDKR